jgi:Rha family phage regulatory protein
MTSIPILNPMQLVAERGGRLVTTSRDVGRVFSKRHDNVLRDIASLDCGEEFARLNFEVCFENNELQNGRPNKFVRMTKDGFMLLVMGFTGPRAMALKIAFINAFNAMAEFIRSRAAEFNTAYLDYRHEKDGASRCGRELRRWRDRKRAHLRRLDELRPYQFPLLT